MKAGRWLVAYDMSRDLDRERVAAHLLQRGIRKQRSVFEVDVEEVGAMLADLGDLIDLDRDVVEAFRQCRACSREARGIGQTGPSLRLRWWVA